MQEMDEPNPALTRYFAGCVITGKYRFVRRLDEGGMGQVWVAHNMDLDVHVAVKVLRAELDAPLVAARLFKEARIVAKLDHPSIVRMYDVGRSDNGDPFIVMELLHGECLADTLNRSGTLPPREAVSVLLPVVDALSVAHDCGVVHRDLKPDNIFLAETAGGRLQPKVVDFGIARLERDPDARLTGAGSLIGSPGYMSPEQARGLSDVDTRSDVWSLCVVLYEVLGGVMPFCGDNYNATLRAIIENAPTPLPQFADCDPELWSIVARGLEKTREGRWQSMRDLGTALAQWLYARGITEDVTRASLHAIWLEAARISSVPPVALSVSSPPQTAPPLPPPAQDSRDSRAAQQLTTGGHGAVSVGSPTRQRQSWRSVAAIASGVAFGLGAAVVYSALSSTTGHESTPVSSTTGHEPKPNVAAPASQVILRDEPVQPNSAPDIGVEAITPASPHADAGATESAAPSGPNVERMPAKAERARRAPSLREPSKASRATPFRPREL
jgi:serine/threonine protein kinase